MINPNGEFFIATTESNQIVIYNIEHGLEESSLELPEINCIVSHETFPVVTIGTCHGFVYILAVIDPKAATIIHKFYLCREKIDGIQFVSGSHHVVANSANDFFILKVSQTGDAYE